MCVCCISIHVCIFLVCLICVFATSFCVYILPGRDISLTKEPTPPPTPVEKPVRKRTRKRKAINSALV